MNSLGNARRSMNSPLLKEQLPPWRSKLMQVLFIGALGYMVYSAFNMQVMKPDYYLKKGEERYQRTVLQPAQRGRILDREGRILAANEEVYSVFAKAASVPKGKKKTSGYSQQQRRKNPRLSQLAQTQSR